MNSYKFLLKHYKAIKEASIELNGITVLAGENGAGKSTITRWLYYLVEGITRYEDFVYEDFYRDVYSILRDFRMILRDTHLMNEELVFLINQWNKLSKTIEYGSNEDVGHLANEAMEIINKFGDYVNDNIKPKKGTLRINMIRAMRYLDIEDVEDFDKRQFVKKYNSRVNAYYDDFVKKLNSRSVRYLFNYIRQHFDRTFKIPESIDFSEYGVSIIGKSSFGHLLGLRRAIYIDTPMAVGNGGIENQLWENLSALLGKENNVDLDVSKRKMLMRIQHIIHGTIQFKDDVFEPSMRYLREDQLLDIPLMETATGMKSFAYIIRLLQNGYLDKNTLLIIDEPEAHLHPQWIVEYARVLILLEKEIGVRILIASHNPDMVAAIQSIGKKEGIDNAITFYQAYSSKDDPYEYEYKNLGFEITEIFKSFNIALSRIEDYGTINNK